MAKQGRAGAENAVAEAIRRLGGGTKAAAVAGVRTATIYAWRDAGAISLLLPAVRIARALEQSAAKRDALIAALAGLK